VTRTVLTRRALNRTTVARQAPAGSDQHRSLVVGGLAAVLVDGFARAVWTITRDGDTATLVVRALDGRLPAADQAAVTEEGARLLAFAAADAARHDVRFAPPP
jgi:Winged helix DNA-binding domain